MNQMKIIKKLKWVKDVDTDFDYLDPHISYRLYVGKTDTNYSVTPIGHGYKDHICLLVAQAKAKQVLDDEIAMKRAEAEDERQRDLEDEYRRAEARKIMEQ
jgi:hypothetical protein